MYSLLLNMFKSLQFYLVPKQHAPLYCNTINQFRTEPHQLEVLEKIIVILARLGKCHRDRSGSYRDGHLNYLLFPWKIIS